MIFLPGSYVLEEETGLPPVCVVLQAEIKILPKIWRQDIVI